MSSDKVVVIDRLLSVPGVRLEKRGIVFDGEPTERELASLLAGLDQLNESITFWRGDSYGRLVKLRIAHEKAEHPNLKPERAEQLELETLTSYAEMRNLHRDEVVNIERTMAFFPHAARRDNLSFAHHKEAFAAADGDLLKANGWLDLAESKGWTVVELRSFIRKDLARESALNAESGAPTTTDEEVDVRLEELKLWATKRLREVQKLKPEAARAMLADLAPLVQLIEAVRRLAGPPQGAQGR